MHLWTVSCCLAPCSPFVESLARVNGRFFLVTFSSLAACSLTSDISS